MATRFANPVRSYALDTLEQIQSHTGNGDSELARALFPSNLSTAAKRVASNLNLNWNPSEASFARLAQLVSVLPVLGGADADYFMLVFGLRLVKADPLDRLFAIEERLSLMQRVAYVAWYGLSGDRMLDRAASWLRTSLENEESLSEDEYLDPYPETSAMKEATAWKTRARSCIQAIENIAAIASLINFIAFLTGGKYRTLFERILRIRVVPRSRSSPMSNANFEYMNRELVWRSLTDFMSYMIPLVNLVRIRRKMMVAGTAFTRSILKRIQEPKTPSSKTANSAIETTSEANQPNATEDKDLETALLLKMEQIEEPENACPLCVDAGRWEDVKRVGGTSRIVARSNACICCLYCYYCLKAAVMEDDEYACGVCGERVEKVVLC
ncbi:hypothetical protein CcCBS67573_g04762 [Chytriomyces confervae]|uniref:RING-type E3 ubiquitin transferase (cysteine targeting) n=1 Tax=Chytriomyces confervae TaxID=246404 RepID=A0A507FFA4_9FUNG|nr:peroxisome assembly protein (Peroxin-2) [Chytriomyces hyalinus]TPX73978.1 hypothetical protein CcCBS67573_g04762 [Chytriomyces confervae]